MGNINNVAMLYNAESVKWLVCIVMCGIVCVIYISMDLSIVVASVERSGSV